MTTKINKLFTIVSADLDAGISKLLKTPDTLNISTGQAQSLVSFTNDDKLQAILPRTEASASTRLYEVFGHHVSYIEPEDSWYVWNGKIHEPVKSDTFAQKMVTALWKSITENIDAVEDMWTIRELSPDQTKELRKHWSRHRFYRDRLASTAGKAALIQLMKVDFQVDDDHFLDDRRWFVTQECVFDMDAVRATGQFDPLPHSPERPVYRMFPAIYDPEAKSPALNQFLSGSIADPTQAAFFGKAVAVALFGAVTPDTSTIVSIQGATRSGKSMINGVLEDICGEGTGYYAEPPEDAITHNGRNKKHARYDMRNARYVAFSEVRNKIDHGFILKYTGGDGYQIEQKYVSGQTVKPQGIIFVANNTSLDVDLTDPAMFRRLAPINFPWTFSKEDPDHWQDETLRSRIVAEASGFLNWMISSYTEFLVNGLDRSDSMMELLRGERSDDDSVSDWLEDRAINGKRFNIDHKKSSRQCIPLAEAMADYVQYSRDIGTKPTDVVSKTAFRDRLGELGYESTRADGTRIKGISQGDALSRHGN